MKKSKHDSGNGSENIRARDCKRGKDIDSTLTSPTLYSCLVTASPGGFGKIRKGSEKDKKDACKCVTNSRHIRRLNTPGHVEKMCLVIEITEKTMTIHNFFLPEN